MALRAWSLPRPLASSRLQAGSRGASSNRCVSANYIVFCRDACDGKGGRQMQHQGSDIRELACKPGRRPSHDTQEPRSARLLPGRCTAHLSWLSEPGEPTLLPWRSS
jgi:hypothetical protein